MLIYDYNPTVRTAPLAAAQDVEGVGAGSESVVEVGASDAFLHLRLAGLCRTAAAPCTTYGVPLWGLRLSDTLESAPRHSGEQVFAAAVPAAPACSLLPGVLCAAREARGCAPQRGAPLAK